MRIVIAPDSFKDALGAADAAEHIAAGLRLVAPNADIDLCPVADGGEGFTQAMVCGSPRGRLQMTPTVDPLGRAIDAQWATLLNVDDQCDTAVIELAAASGLERLKLEERDPCKTSTFGTGALIAQALHANARRILIGIGGSATNDAGCGVVLALGGRFFDQAGEEIRGAVTGANLKQVSRIELDELHPRLSKCTVRVACDVTNPLAGPSGAAHVYGPQKGATPKQVEQLDAGLRHMAKLWREQLGVDVEHMPGAGAAGGVGGGLVAMLGAELVPGAELVLDTIGFDERIKGADLVITGEGRLDSQSLHGKAAMTVAKRAAAAGVQCVALVGSVGDDADEALSHGLSEYRVIGEGLDADESIRRTAELLEQAAIDVAKQWLR